MKLRALRRFWLATEKRSVEPGEVFALADPFDALELCDGTNAELVDDRARVKRKDRAVWFPVDLDRERMAPDPAAIAASIRDMQSVSVGREGFVRRWRGDRPRRFFGLL